MKIQFVSMFVVDSGLWKTQSILCVEALVCPLKHICSNFCYFRNTYTSKALHNFLKFLFMQRARDYGARKHSY